MKQTKMVKFIFAIALLIPVVLVCVGIVQSVSLQIKRQQLENSQTQLELKKEELKKDQEILEYLNSDEYKNEYQSHEENGDDYYGNDGDIEVTIKQ